MTVEAFGVISREEFEDLAARTLKISEGEHTFVALHDADAGTTRFANNQVVQHVHSRRITLSITVAYGQRHGTASATDVGEEALRDAVGRASRIARVSPADPEYLPPLPPQCYPRLETVREETLRAGPERRLEVTGDAIHRCQAERLTAAGIVGSSLSAVGLAANTGLLAYEQQTEARFSVTAMGENSSGWAATAHRSFDKLAAAERTSIAIEKARRSAGPREMPPGRYPTILEPAAVAGLVAPLIWMMDAKSYYKGTSPFTGRLGKLLLDPRLTLRNYPDHPDLFGQAFTGEGLPTDGRAWIENGVLKQLRYDRFTAQEHHVAPSPSLNAPYLSGEGSSGYESGDLVRSTKRGILVSNFWYIRSVNPTDLTLTGMTRDGTFLIEDGEIVSGLFNFRFHESPLRVLAKVEAFTAPGDASTLESGKMELPAVRVGEFNFSSVTRF